MTNTLTLLDDAHMADVAGGLELPIAPVGESRHAVPTPWGPHPELAGATNHLIGPCPNPDAFPKPAPNPDPFPVQPGPFVGP